ncbi:MAG: radical SAM protein [Rhodospirillaceae bacterium]|nr:radical SAM protein [Rhodospirillaceae bacterium]
MLDYNMPLYRPPSEGANLIIQATLGCSFNECSFCSMYKSKTYRPRPLDQVFADIDAAAAEWPGAHRVFLADGDALTLPMEDLERILEKLSATFPALGRVSSYGTPVNLLRKTPDELERLRRLKLSLLYVGVESGSAEVLRRITKGASPGSLEKALTKAAKAGLKVSATVILGLGGRDLWQEHIDGTADVINRAPPTYLSTLQLGLDDDVKDRFMTRFARMGGDFQWQDDSGVLDELHRLVERLDPPRPVIFRSNHASNALALAGNLPKDKGRLLAEIDAARRGETRLRPVSSRGL